MYPLDLQQAPSEIDLYLTASKYRGEEPSRRPLAGFNPDSILYYGGQNAAELLAQFDALQQGEDYAAVLVLTDGSGYELTSQGIEVPVSAAPVWLVHLGGDFPLGYDDNTLTAIQASGGGVAASLKEALTRLTVRLEQDQTASSNDLIDGYRWTTITSGPSKAQAGRAQAIPADEDFAALAARWLILSEIEQQRGSLAEAETLDQLHAIAMEHGIVTPYSSMIVLVTPEQQRLLNQLEGRGDRFQREYEELGDTSPENPFEVTGVPEPEEWLLLALAAAMLGWYLYTSRRKLSFQEDG